MRVFLDTNIVFDFLLDSRGEFHKPAADLMRLASEGVVDVGFSTSQVTDIAYSLQKLVGDAEARDALRRLFVVCDLYETSLAACVDALYSAVKDYEDAVQAETAKAHGCDYIVTRDAKGFKRSDISVLSAAELVKELM